MTRTLLATGHLTWDAVERRSDRYGSVNLYEDEDKDVLLNPELDALEGKQGRLVAEVLLPVRSLHMGDLARGFTPSIPAAKEIVVLGEGALFVEHRGRAIHEKSAHERHDDDMFKLLEEAFSKMNGNFKIGSIQRKEESGPRIYDLVGLKPDDGREKDWLDPLALYRLHSSKINLYFDVKSVFGNYSND